MKNNQFNGYGIMQYSNKICYRGYWLDGKRNGFGQLIDSNGIDLYSGHWKDDQYDGYGTSYTYDQKKAELLYYYLSKRRLLVTSNYRTLMQSYYLYDGYYKRNQRHGQGKQFIYENHSISRYNGQFCHNLYHNFGYFIDNEKNIYVGQYDHQLREGQGQLIYGNGLYRYVGEWRKDKKNGSGLLYFNNVVVFDGQWKENEKEGIGNENLNDHYMYTGEFHGNYKNGNGSIFDRQTKKQFFSCSYKNDRIVYNETIPKDTIFADNAVSILECSDGQYHDIHDEMNNPYSGGVKNHQKEGNVLESSPAQSCYEGQFEKYQRDGYGKIIDNEGIVLYDGEWKKDKRHGRGISLKYSYIYYISNDGQSEEIDKVRESWPTDLVLIRNGKKKGKEMDIDVELDDQYTTHSIRHRGEKEEDTSCYCSSLTKYVGEWKEDERDGYGEEFGENSLVYKGEWKRNKKNGKGVLYHHGHIIYDGEWKEDQKEGHGIFYNEDQYKVYEGEWKGDAMNGHGKLYNEKEECVFDGEFKDNQRDGFGVEYEHNQCVYSGFWKENQRHDQGTLYSASGRKVYEGEWRNDAFYGLGILYEQNQDIEMNDVIKSTGYWIQNARFQNHLYQFDNGYIYDGEWKDNCLDGFGTLYDSFHAPVYVGQWKRNLFHGHGVYSHNSFVYDGDFYQHQFHGRGVVKYQHRLHVKCNWYKNFPKGKVYCYFVEKKKHYMIDVHENESKISIKELIYQITTSSLYNQGS